MSRIHIYPEWVLKHRVSGTNVTHVKGKYYLYEVTSVWNKEKKRAQKITKKYLGRITKEEGLILSGSRLKIEKVSVKEYGACNVLNNIGSDVIERLKEYFDDGETIFTMATLKLLEQCSFSKMEQLYRHSYLSEMYKDKKLSSKDISLFMRTFGEKREKIVAFMNSFISGNEHILFDGTNIVSSSEKMNISRLGKEYESQINLLYAFACESKMPVYYRIIAGNIVDVSAFKLSLQETKLKDMVVIADKGFGSKANFDLLEESEIKYVVPLKRSNTLINLNTGDKSNFDDYFLFNDRPIWYKALNEVIIYLDSDLKIMEEKDYIKRIEQNMEGYTKANFIERQYKFGTIILKTNLTNKSPKDIYYLYKKRLDIEQSFDFLKNSLNSDRSYMQNEKSLETWAFINHIALMLNYKVYNLLESNNLLSKYSVSDFLLHLKYIFKIKVNDTWFTSEITNKTKKLLEMVGVHIT